VGGEGVVLGIAAVWLGGVHGQMSLVEGMDELPQYSYPSMDNDCCSSVDRRERKGERGKKEGSGERGERE